MVFWIRRLSLYLSAIVCVGCSEFTAMHTFGFPEDVDAYNEFVIESLKTGSQDVFNDQLSAELAAIETVQDNIAEVQAEIREHPTDFEAVLTQTRRVTQNGEATQTYYSIWESSFGDGYISVELSLLSDDACCLIQGLNIYKDADRPSTRNDWGKAPLTTGRIVFLLVAAANVIFILVTLVACIKDKTVPRRKWLWVIFVLMGLWGLTLNWTTGAVSPNFISMQGGSLNLSFIKFQILGSGFGKAGLYQPWLIDMGLPLGAILYWWRRRSWVTNGSLDGDEQA